MVRRLKEDIRETQGGFPQRIVEPVVVDGLPEHAPELVLSVLLDEYRRLREERFRQAPTRQQSAAALLTVGLQQRLLSSIEAFARSLAVHRKTVRRQWDLSAGIRPDTRSTRSSGEAFLRTTGPDDDEEDFASDIEDEHAPERAAEAADAEERAEIEALDCAAEAESSRDAAARELWDKEQSLLARMAQIADQMRGLPDAKTRRLLNWIRENLCPGLPSYGHAAAGAPARWNDRRVLIFTENREGTKRYLRKILETAIAGTERAAERIETIDGLGGRRPPPRNPAPLQRPTGRGPAPDPARHRRRPRGTELPSPLHRPLPFRPAVEPGPH